MRVRWLDIAILVVFAVFLVYFFWPAHINGEPSGRAACMSNMLQIGLAMVEYATDHEGAYPPSFGALLKEGYLTRCKVFICPSGTDKVPHDFPLGPEKPDATDNYKDVDLQVLNRVHNFGSYVMVRGLKHASRADIIILHGKSGNHGGEGRSCLFNDGHVKWISEEEFQKRMKAQQASIREMRKKTVE